MDQLIKYLLCGYKELSSDAKHPHKKQDEVVHTSDPNTGEAGMKRCLGLADQPIYLRLSSCSMRDLGSEVRWREAE